MIFRAAIFLTSIASTGVVVAFAPHGPASAVAHRTSARRSFASSLELSSEPDSLSSYEMATGDHSSDIAAFVAPVDPSSENVDDEAVAVEEDVPKPQHDFALLFDCDGVILETEELHRLAYNAAFREFQVTRVCGDVEEPVEWSVGYYDILQNSIGGGKPKMRHYFSQLLRFESNERGDPTMITATVQNRKQKRKAKRKKSGTGSSASTVTLAANDVSTGLETLIDAIQTRKTELYKTTVEETATPRPGLLDLMDEALADDSIAVGVCSASTKEAAQKVLECTLGPDRVSKLDVCILGDDVSEKKPSPLIYDTARARLGIDTPERCVVVEDSAVGLRAAKAAGMRCLITYTASTTNEDFYGMGADAKVPDLVNRGNPVTLDSIFDPLRAAFSSPNEDFTVVPELLVGLKDDPVADDEEEELYDEDDNLIVTDTNEEETTPEDDPLPEAITEESSLEEVEIPPVAEAEESDEDAKAEEPFVEYSSFSTDDAAGEEEEKEAPPAAEVEPVAAAEEPSSEPEEPTTEEEELPPPAPTPEMESTTPEPPVPADSATVPPPPRRILKKVKMVQDDMGNFSM